MFLISNILGQYDLIVQNNTMHGTIASNTQIEIEAIAFRIKSGYIVHSKDKYYWSKSTIRQYLDKYTIKGCVGYRPPKHNLSKVCTLPQGIGDTIINMIKEQSITGINKNIIFSSKDKAWYIFALCGIITGEYKGDETFSFPLELVLNYAEYQSLDILLDKEYIGLEYIDTLFRYRLYQPIEGLEQLTQYNAIHYRHIKANRKYEDTGNFVNFGTRKFREQISNYGTKYINRDLTFYRLSII